MSATRAKATALLAVLQLTAATLWAQRPGVDTLFPPQPVGYVNDLASVIDAESAAKMEDLIGRLRAATGAEVAVVTLPLIGEQDPAEVARAIGRPRAVRAVARACATNPVCVVVPCHRVVAKSGEMAGYRWGQARKARLIALESAGPGERRGGNPGRHRKAK